MKTNDIYVERFEEDFHAIHGTMFIEPYDSLTCKHEECPYKGCGYHRHTTSKCTNASLSLWSEFPVYMPKSQEAMKDCMSYLDI